MNSRGWLRFAGFVAAAVLLCFAFSSLFDAIQSFKDAAEFDDSDGTRLAITEMVMAVGQLAAGILILAAAAVGTTSVARVAASAFFFTGVLLNVHIINTLSVLEMLGESWDAYIFGLMASIVLTIAPFLNRVGMAALGITGSLLAFMDIGFIFEAEDGFASIMASFATNVDFLGEILMATAVLVAAIAVARRASWHFAALLVAVAWSAASAEALDMKPWDGISDIGGLAEASAVATMVAAFLQPLAALVFLGLVWEGTGATTVAIAETSTTEPAQAETAKPVAHNHRLLKCPACEYVNRVPTGHKPSCGSCGLNA